MHAEDFPRLSNATLSAARPGVVLPAIDRDALNPGIVHLGLGAFFRAHGALFVEDAMAASGGDWGIIGASLRHPDQRDRLAPQDFLYTALERGPEGDRARIAGCVLDVIVAPEDPARLVSVMADPAIRIVSLTVTEKGYCHDPATGRLNRIHPDIAHDLANPDTPVSAPGFIVAALSARRTAGIPPFTVLCCDNLPSNGRLVEGLVIELASLFDEGLAGWIAANTRFPSTMVDRIVPATGGADLIRVREITGLRDDAPVVMEPFRQWVIEDDFVNGERPDFGAAGAELVADVTPFELMKLRMLNGTHSALAYLGYLAGHETIVETISDPVFAAYVRLLWDNEIIPVVPAPPGTDLAHYAATLFTRYSNPAIRHRTWQIAMDGSQKLPQRLLGTVRDRLRRGGPIVLLGYTIAAWIRYVGGTDEAGNPIDVRDPMAAELRRVLEAAGEEAGAKVAAVLDVDAIFGGDLKSSTDFRESVTEALTAIMAKGARAAVADLVAGR